MKQQGTVTKQLGGFFFVADESGKVVRCVCRGRLRQEQGGILAGDRVFFVPDGCDGGVIEEVLPRQSELSRPRVANVDLVVCVQSVTDPEPDTVYVDRLLALSGSQNIAAAICLNKTDLTQKAGPETFPASVYNGVGYPVARTSAVTGKGISELARLLQGHISCLAGPSGVGKSSILNQLIPGAQLEVGGVSHRLRRGRHTTRAVELLILPGGGFVADTPGFSRLELDGVEGRELQLYFPELRKLVGQCRFNDCLHVGEEGCAVIDAVNCGEIASFRYDNYRALLEEALELERRRYR